MSITIDDSTAEQRGRQQERLWTCSCEGQNYDPVNRCPFRMPYACWLLPLATDCIPGITRTAREINQIACRGGAGLRFQRALTT